jgi:hypothetical protein
VANLTDLQVPNVNRISWCSKNDTALVMGEKQLLTMTTVFWNLAPVKPIQQWPESYI